MDIALLTAFLTPFLPALAQLGEKAAGKMAEKFGEDAQPQTDVSQEAQRTCKQYAVP